MKLDPKSLDRLLKLNDDQLRGVILKLAASKGVDVSGLRLGPAELQMIRAALGSASGEDLQKVVDGIGAELVGRSVHETEDGKP